MTTKTLTIRITLIRVSNWNLPCMSSLKFYKCNVILPLSLEKPYTLMKTRTKYKSGLSQISEINDEYISSHNRQSWQLPKVTLMHEREHDARRRDLVISKLDIWKREKLPHLYQIWQQNKKFKCRIFTIYCDSKRTCESLCIMWF